MLNNVAFKPSYDDFQKFLIENSKVYALYHKTACLLHENVPGVMALDFWVSSKMLNAIKRVIRIAAYCEGHAPVVAPMVMDAFCQMEGALSEARRVWEDTGSYDAVSAVIGNMNIEFIDHVGAIGKRFSATN